LTQTVIYRHEYIRHGNPAGISAAPLQVDSALRRRARGQRQARRLLFPPACVCGPLDAAVTPCNDICIRICINYAARHGHLHDLTLFVAVRADGANLQLQTPSSHLGGALSQNDIQTGLYMYMYMYTYIVYAARRGRIHDSALFIAVGLTPGGRVDTNSYI